MRYDDAAWLLACGALTAVGVLIAVLTYRKRGWSAALRVGAWAVLPIAVWLTGLSRLVGTVAYETVRWAGNLLFSPRVWVGVALFGVAFVVLGGLGFVRRRRARTGAATEEAPDRPAAKPASPRPAVGQGNAKEGKGAKGSESDPLEGFEEIDEILKKRGIT